ncbi:integrin alpha-M isoform X1 [Alligator mississippiensis]|uniref:integrin alpha-M isoform X1 n=1 Tax=Alligator mississippiensis TaxID=8496 RepID=UPI002877A2E7|nr:integrin alpha-M isoform X1 [Alligator mississippiensis]
MDPLALLLYLGAALASCHGFNVDVDRPISFQEAAVGFGQSLAMSAQAGGLFVGAPLQRGGINDTGRVYKCDPRAQTCQQIRIPRPADAVDMSLGLSLAATDSQVLVCGPTVRQACGENMYVRGYCFLLDRNLRPTQRFPETLPECPKRQTDIVFLIDGSGSVIDIDFNRMKRFIIEVIDRFESTDTQFALVQFSSSFRVHFDFNTFKRTSNVETLVWDVMQLQGGTYTASAIRKVVQNVFVPWRGARASATKVLIVITDGEKTERLRYRDVIPEAEREGIVRYAIGVGEAFSSPGAQKELNEIASDPDTEHVFQVNNFDALQGLQSQLQEKIFAIEGTQSQRGSSFQLEMSQEGFSALLSPDGPILGAVGAYDWSGGFFLYGGIGEAAFINVSTTSGDMKDAYLGYAVQRVTSGKRRGYVVGAPRYQHVGKVVLFYWDPRSEAWRAEAEKIGDQIGSYFGGSLSTMDVDGDGNTDLILVGAPMYYGEGSGGRVFVCPLPAQGAPLRCDGVLRGQGGQPLGRFGASLAVLGDVDGDGHADLAVGAPLEDGARGALYIFRGQQRRLRERHSQRITGTQVSGAPWALGLTLSGGTDLTGDGLKDIAVGARGQVLLLRSRPVLQAAVTVTFAPTTIPVTAFDCQGREQLDTEAATARICFSLRLSLGQRFQGGSISGTFYYELALDPGRIRVRAAFNPPLPAQPLTLPVSLHTKCQEYRVRLPVCPEDTLTPINLRLSYNLTGIPIPGGGLTPILAEDTETTVVASLPFDKNCGSDNICMDDLQIAFNFSGLDTLVVGDTQDLQIMIRVHNLGEDSYGATLQLLHPAVLSYRKVQVLQASRGGVAVRCSSLLGGQAEPQRNSTCLVGPPIFRAGAQVIFTTTLDVPATAELGDHLRISASTHSDNRGPRSEGKSQSMELPVKYAIHIIVTGSETSTKYVNISSNEEGASRVVTHRYQVQNLRHRSPPVWVTFEYPVALNGAPLWVAEVVPSQPINCSDLSGMPGTKEVREEMKKSPLLSCAVATCRRVRCEVPALHMEQPLEFVLTGNVTFGWFSQMGLDKVTLASVAEVGADPRRFHQQGATRLQVQTVLERIGTYNYLPVILGSSIGGLILLAVITAALYKFGFFRRHYKQMMDTAQDSGGPAPTPGPAPSAPPQ